MDLGLAGKIALVTGASRGIGRAIARELAAEGCDLVATARDAALLQSLADEVQKKTNRRVIVHAVDLREPAGALAAVEAAVKGFGRLDILVNNAAEQHETEEPLEIDARQLERTFRTNVFGTFFMTKAALRHMKEGSTIINTTSITAYRGHKTLIDYAATRGAIVAFTRSLSQALLADRKIRVNGVAPGPIWTPLIPASFDAERVAEHGSSVPMGRAGQPNEVAPCYVFLASEESSYISGQVLHPNGGAMVDS